MKRRTRLLAPPSSLRARAHARIDIYAVLSRDVLCVTDRPKSSEETESRVDVNRLDPCTRMLARVYVRRLPGRCTPQVCGHYSTSVYVTLAYTMTTRVHACKCIDKLDDPGSIAIATRDSRESSGNPGGFPIVSESRNLLLLLLLCRFDENGGSPIPPFLAEDPNFDPKVASFFFFSFLCCFFLPFPCSNVTFVPRDRLDRVGGLLIGELSSEARSFLRILTFYAAGAGITMNRAFNVNKLKGIYRQELLLSPA